MLKKTLLTVLLGGSLLGFSQQKYQPTQANLKARTEFQDEKFGMFIHFGLYSELGRGEWVMNNDKIPVNDYAKLKDFFNPIGFNAKEYVSMAKNAGVKYITLVTRHHDGFSMWNTKYSDFNIMNTPFKRDLVKELADECHKQGVKIAFYYSLLDWTRTDYSYWTGRTGKGTGRTEKGNWNDYIQFMKNQLTELLTNYGEVSGIWFDGYWDQMEEEKAGRSEKTYLDWKMPEIYELIHKLQPQCLVGNNHHITPLEGEDFQMFERDIPGQNEHGLSFQKPSQLPLETCATLNDSWGFDLKDNKNKTFKEFLNLLVNAAGSNANLLMNIGPMPNGKVPQPFINSFKEMGEWISVYGESIYGTRGGYLPLQKWGAITQKPGKIYVHILKNNEGKAITLEKFPFKKINSAYLLKDKKTIKYTLKNNTLTFDSYAVDDQNPDTVIVFEGK
ncbi:alpha-L-fucosidase [Elizabethkingia anophelis]|uniref:alpha-L-fucosidase n=1 Tax=Elizabethkingia anophelis TaxID=1117645 RepID=A0A7Z7PX87_9FLAO|nr:alpha-L-fucosidase [Elizabethkingia anophelis]MCT3630215.1 alpha-L-fucosidase [Elizabethkingia anophelis]MCT3633729.1 alpha-L-fucosidase [Elizabethkingia anophelis]MCT3692852.1 alpha-L-fucosidase [Elizabethkingia anophelis]MCT3720866.1 alpha-L-fucosidase [Elizabethkingia anophelis]MCT3724527.1 alpha-L-fucosidase [Elizabethkingia anophelis]